jgi:hypothetical protein
MIITQAHLPHKISPFELETMRVDCVTFAKTKYRN